MSKLTPAVAKKITSDWLGEFPYFGVFRPMWLMRRVGPLLQGICLDRDAGGETYLPTSHVHCLTRSFPVVTLSLPSTLRTLRTDAVDRIAVSSHDGVFRDAAARLRHQSPILMAANASCGELAASIKNALRKVAAFDLGSRVVGIEAQIALFAWCGELDAATQAIADARSEIAETPLTVLGDHSLHAWEDRQRRLVTDPKSMVDQVSKEVVRLKVRDLPEGSAERVH